MSSKKMTILGCGRWASYLAYIYQTQGYQIMMWGLECDLEQLSKTRIYSRSNFSITLPKEVKFTFNLGEALAYSDLILMVIKAEAVGDFSKIIKQTQVDLTSKDLVLCMKGLDKSGQRLSVVVAQTLSGLKSLSVLFGPAHGEEIIGQSHEAPMVLAQERKMKNHKVAHAKILAKKLSNKYLFVTVSEDLVGTEYSGVFKNIAGLACGMLTGMAREDLIGPFVSYYIQEVEFFIKALGGKARTAQGLGFLGELKTTMLSNLSKNFNEGFDYISSDGALFPQTCEGINSVKVMLKFAKSQKLKAVQYPVLATLQKIFFSPKPFNRAKSEVALKKMLFQDLPKIYKF